MKNAAETWWGTHNLMVTAAHRYCLGRRTYIVSECVDWLKKHWDKFDEHTRERIVLETKEALDRDHAGDDCDRKEWSKISVLEWRIAHKSSND